MKKLEIIIRPEKLEDLKAILEESNVKWSEHCKHYGLR